MQTSVKMGLIFIVLSALFLYSTSIYGKKNDSQSLALTVNYALPKTGLNITIITSKTMKYKGIFSNYANKYMGLQNSINKNEVIWKINAIRADIFADVTLEDFYEFSLSPNETNYCINLSEEGIILGVNLKKETDEMPADRRNSIVQTNEQIKNEYAEFACDKNYQFIKKTTYSSQLTDSGVIKVPKIVREFSSKNLEQKAREAAEFIYKIREERFWLLSSATETEILPPDGKAYEITLKALDELEDKYMKLFTGEILTTSHSFTYKIVPTRSKKTMLCRFSKTKGITPATHSTGVALYVNFFTPTIEKRSAIKNTAGLYYHIPVKSKVSITLNTTTYFSDEILMGQFGRLMFLPKELIQSNKQIEYYKNTGAIKRITNYK